VYGVVVMVAVVKHVQPVEVVVEPSQCAHRMSQQIPIGAEKVELQRTLVPAGALRTTAKGSVQHTQVAAVPGSMERACAMLPQMAVVFPAPAAIFAITGPRNVSLRPTSAAKERQHVRNAKRLDQWVQGADLERSGSSRENVLV